MFHILEKLRLGRTGVTEHQNVDITTEPVLSLDILGLTADEGEGNGRLDVFMAVDGWTDALEDLEVGRESELMSERGKCCLMRRDIPDERYADRATTP